MNIPSNPLFKKEPNITKQNTLKHLKLSFNKQSLLNLYLSLKGFSESKHYGKPFAIKRINENENSFFQKLFNLLNSNKNNTSLLKITTINNTLFWTTAKFIINSSDRITFTINNRLINKDNEVRLNKLFNVLDLLEKKSNNINISEKYLYGFLEEKGENSFNDYINKQFQTSNC